MKRIVLIAAPAGVFVLTAMAGWLAGPPRQQAAVMARSHVESPRQRAVAAEAEDGGILSALRQLESKIVLPTHTPADLTEEPHDAKGMDDVIFSSSGFGMGSVSYAMEWAEESPEAMFQWLVRQSGERSGYADLLFEKWAARDMTAALAAVFDIPNAKIRRQALITSLEILASRDLPRACELLQQNLDLFPVGGDWLALSAGKASYDLLLGLPASEERTHLIAQLLNCTSSSNEARSFWAEALESDRRAWVAAGFAPYTGSAFDGLDDLMRERAETTGDPAAAAKFIECHGEAWAKRDLPAALDWAQAHLKGKRKVECLEKFFQVGIRENFEATLEFWQKLPQSYLKDTVAEAMLRGVPDEKKTAAEAVLDCSKH